MKRKTIKKIASLLALTLTATAALAGCGDKKEQTNTNASSEAESSTDAGETADSSEEVVEKTGRVRVMVPDNSNIPAEEGDLLNNRWTEWIRENAPVAEIEFVPIIRAEAYELTNMAFAAGDGPDFYNNPDARLTDFVNQGLAAEITDEMLDKMPNYKALLEAYPVVRKNNSRNGKLYGFGGAGAWSHNHTLVIRQDWMENLGLNVPKTTDELFDILYAFTYNDPDGNGVDDTWGMNMTTDAQRVTAHMFGFGNPEKYKFDENGDFVYAWDNIEAWLGFVKKIVDNKLVNPDFMTMKGDDDQADFFAGRIGVWCSGRMGDYGSRWASFKEAQPDAKITTFPLPDGGFGKYTANGNSGINSTGFLSSDYDDLDAALAYIDWLYDPEVTSYLKNGPEGVYNARNEYGTWTEVDPEKKKVEFDYRSCYTFVGTSLKSEADIAAGYSDRANDNYNKSLTSDDLIRQEHGVLNFKMFTVANEDNVPDPRVYLSQGKPALPEELTLIASTTDGLVNDLLKAGIADSSKSAADIVAEAKATWEGAGGADVDAWYKEYYATDASALLPEDFMDLKITPEMTPIAREHAEAFGFDPDNYDMYDITK